MGHERLHRRADFTAIGVPGRNPAPRPAVLTGTDAPASMSITSPMKSSIALIVLALAGLAACSSISPAQRNAQALAQYTQYAGEPVSDFRYYSRLRTFQALSNDKVFVRTGNSDAYLLTVFPCINLEFATRIGMSTQFGAVRSGFDDVLVDGERCRISEIRPVNYRQMRADAKESGPKLIG